MAAFSYSLSPLSPTPRPSPRFLPLVLLHHAPSPPTFLFAFTGGNGSGKFSMYSFFFCWLLYFSNFFRFLFGPAFAFTEKKTVGAQTTTNRTRNYLFKSIKFSCRGIWEIFADYLWRRLVNPYILEDMYIYLLGRCRWAPTPVKIAKQWKLYNHLLAFRNNEFFVALAFEVFPDLAYRNYLASPCGMQRFFNCTIRICPF